MKQNELFNAISNKSGASKGDVESVMKALGEVTTKALGNGDDVTIPGIAKLVTKDRAARMGRNPKTGEAVNIPAKTVVGVKIAKALADHVA